MNYTQIILAKARTTPADGNTFVFFTVTIGYQVNFG